MTNTTDSATSAPLGANHHVNAAPAATVAPPRTLSIVSLVLGGASVLFGYTFFVPIAAVVLGFLGLQREPAGRTMATWGIVLGLVMSVGWLIIAVTGLAVIAPLHFLAGF
jgi:hypothetical protein